MWINAQFETILGPWFNDSRIGIEKTGTRADG